MLSTRPRQAKRQLCMAKKKMLWVDLGAAKRPNANCCTWYHTVSVRKFSLKMFEVRCCMLGSLSPRIPISGTKNRRGPWGRKLSLPVQRKRTGCRLLLRTSGVPRRMSLDSRAEFFCGSSFVFVASSIEAEVFIYCSGTGGCR